MAKETHPTPEQLAERQKAQELETERKALPTKSFSSMTRVEKDQLLEYLLKREGLI
jgi:hypothetical protein